MARNLYEEVVFIDDEIGAPLFMFD